LISLLISCTELSGQASNCFNQYYFENVDFRTPAEDSSIKCEPVVTESSGDEAFQNADENSEFCNEEGPPVSTAYSNGTISERDYRESEEIEHSSDSDWNIDWEREKSTYIRIKSGAE